MWPVERRRSGVQRRVLLRRAVQVPQLSPQFRGKEILRRAEGGAGRRPASAAPAGSLVARNFFSLIISSELNSIILIHTVIREAHGGARGGGVTRNFNRRFFFV